jgi:hypothetical protein
MLIRALEKGGASLSHWLRENDPCTNVYGLGRTIMQAHLAG